MQLEWILHKCNRIIVKSPLYLNILDSDRGILTKKEVNTLEVFFVLSRYHNYKYWEEVSRKAKLGEIKVNPYFLLVIAIISEVFGSSMLKIANGFKNFLPSIGVVIGMSVAFYCLSLALQNIPLGTAYAIWSGVGTALTGTIGIVVYKEHVNLQKLLGIILIICGVVILKIASSNIH